MSVRLFFFVYTYRSRDRNTICPLALNENVAALGSKKPHQVLTFSGRSVERVFRSRLL